LVIVYAKNLVLTCHAVSGEEPWNFRDEYEQYIGDNKGILQTSRTRKVEVLH